MRGVESRNFAVVGLYVKGYGFNSFLGEAVGFF